jgi:hypoxanthine phosphoribosyltransferase
MSLSAYPGFNNAFNHIAFDRDTFERKAGRIQILIVDDVCREGKTLYDAKSYVESSIKFTDVEITTAALTAYNTQSEPLYRPRFVVENTDEPVERFGGDLEPFRR